MKHSGSADMPLYGGSIPYWLFERMKKLGRAAGRTINGVEQRPGEDTA